MRSSAWTALACLLAACGSPSGKDPAGSLLDGQIVYDGEPPEQTTVMYTNPDGDLIEAAPVFAGWITLLVPADAPFDQIEALVTARGGTIVEAIPRVGHYVAAVAPGGEAAFLSSIYGEAAVLAAGPSPVLSGDGLSVVDAPYDGIPEGDCNGNHGECVAAVAGRGGGAVSKLDPSWFTVGNAVATRNGRIINFVIQAMEANPDEPAVINLSMGSDGLPGLRSSDWWALWARRDYWWSLAQAIAAEPPNIRDNVVLVVTVGNRGIDVTSAIRTIAANEPVGFARMRMAAGSEDLSKPVKQFNYASEHVVCAPAVNVKINDLTYADGTSFAAPEIARVIHLVWMQVPSLTAPEIQRALDDTLAAAGRRDLPTDEATMWTAQDFIDQFLARARALDDGDPAGGMLAFESGENVGGEGRIAIDVIDLASGQRSRVPRPIDDNTYLAGVSAAGLVVFVDEIRSSGVDSVAAYPDWGRGERIEVSDACPLAPNFDIPAEGADVTDAGQVYFRGTATDLRDTIFSFSATGGCAALDIDLQGDGEADALYGDELAVAGAGGELFFEASAGGEGELYAIALPAGPGLIAARLVTGTFGSSLTVSADGSMLAYRNAADQFVALPAAGGEPVPLGALTGAMLTSVDVGLDPTGRRAVLTGMAGTQVSIFVIDIPAAQAEALSLGLIYPIGLAPRFSAGGDRLVFSAIDLTTGGMLESADLFIMDVAGGEATNVTRTADQAELNPVLR